MYEIVRFLAVCENVKECDCCGKKGLKKTVELAISGKIHYYGVSCAAAALGLTQKTYSARNVQSLVADIEQRDVNAERKAKATMAAQDAANREQRPYVVTVTRGQIGNVYSWAAKEHYNTDNRASRPRAILTIEPSA